MNKLLFVFELPPEHFLYWRDGLYGALKELEKEWEVTYYNAWGKTEEQLKGEFPKDFDFYLGWGNPSSKWVPYLWGSPGKRGFCFGGGNLHDDFLRGEGSIRPFDVVFVENESYLIYPNYRLAFGTNTDTFYFMSQPKMFDALYPAAFANWKHQEVFADICERENLRGLAVGYKQEQNEEESIHLMNYCLVKGVAVMDWVPAKSLNYLYNMSKEVIITADESGGCERAILEAKACELPVRVVSNSKKLHDLNKLTLQEVREKYSHKNYAEALKKGILEVTS